MKKLNLVVEFSNGTYGVYLIPSDRDLAAYENPHKSVSELNKNKNNFFMILEVDQHYVVHGPADPHMRKSDMLIAKGVAHSEKEAREKANKSVREYVIDLWRSDYMNIERVIDRTEERLLNGLDFRFQ